MAECKKIPKAGSGKDRRNKEYKTAGRKEIHRRYKMLRALGRSNYSDVQLFMLLAREYIAAPTIASDARRLAKHRNSLVVGTADEMITTFVKNRRSTVEAAAKVPAKKLKEQYADNVSDFVKKYHFANV